MRVRIYVEPDSPPARGGHSNFSRERDGTTCYDGEHTFDIAPIERDVKNFDS